MELETSTLNGVDLVRVAANRIDAAVAIQFKDQMRALAAQAQPRVVLDLGQVDFVDSSGLGAIVAALKAMPDGTRLELAALRPTVDKVFHMTRMDSIFVIHPTPDAALVQQG